MIVAVLNVIGVVMVLSASSVQSLDSKGTAWWFFERQLLWTGLGVVGLRRRVARRLPAVAPVHGAVPRRSPRCCSSSCSSRASGIWVDGSRRWLGYGRVAAPAVRDRASSRCWSSPPTSWRAASSRSSATGARRSRPVLFVFGAVRVPHHARARPRLDDGPHDHPRRGARRRRRSAPATSPSIARCRRRRGHALRARWCRGAGPGCSRSSTRGTTRRTPATRSRSRSSRSAAAGWTGVGLGASRAKWRFLPAAHTDFIFAIVGEELGLLGVRARDRRSSARSRTSASARRCARRTGSACCSPAASPRGSSARRSSTSARSSGCCPVSGVPLPFVSFGGTALLFTMIAAGMLGNVARQGGR